MKGQVPLKFAGVMIFLTILIAEAVLIFQLRTQAGQNIVTIGDVSITLREPGCEGESERETGQAILIEHVKPGEDVLRDPTIYVGEGSQTAYLRAQVVIKGLPEYQKKDLLEQLELAEEWDYNGTDGYFYYRRPVKEGDAVPFFTGIHIPDRWESMEENICFQLSVAVEAVQSSYLTPDISADCRMLGWIETEALKW